METYDGSGLNQYLSALISDENYIILLAAQGTRRFSLMRRAEGR